MSVVARAKSLLHRLPEIVDLRGRDTRAPGELSLKARFARGAFWSLLGAVISRAIAFVSSVIVARMLGAEGFGEFGIVQSTVFMFGVFAGFGMGLTATKFVAQYRTTDPSRAGNIIGLTLVVSAAAGALLAIALFVLAPWLADKTLHAPQITPLLRVASAYLFLTALNGAQIGALAGFEAYRKLMWVSIVSGIATFPLVIAGTWFLGVQGAILASVAGAVIAWAVTGFALRTAAKQAGVKIEASHLRIEIRTLLTFSLPAAITGMITTPANWVIAAILVNTPNGFRELGIYSAAYQLAAAAIFMQRYAAAPLLPILSSRGGTSRRTMLRLLVLYMIPTIVLVGLGALFSRPISAVFGESFSGLQPVMLVVLAAVVFLMVENIFTSVLQAKGRATTVAGVYMAKCLLLVALALLFRDKGALGLGFAFLGSMALSAVLLSAIAFLEKPGSWPDCQPRL